MSRIEAIEHEIDLLTSEELEILYHKLLKRIWNKNKTLLLLSKYQGIGQGVWNMDAQKYINQLRDDDRF